VRIKTIKAILLIGAVAPAVVLAARAVGHSLGDNPVEAVTYETGDWAILLLAATLSITPLRRLTRNNNLISYRRMLGLLTFFYASLHFGIYLVLDKRLYWSAILTDIPRRPFITAGFGAFVLMIPLAMTSNGAAIRRLGKRWKKLHQWVYVIAVAIVIHYVWMRPHEAKPYFYAALFFTLLLARLWPKGKNRDEEDDWQAHGRTRYTYRLL
jgi:sulfoxide reductase heme-binding subunit YedZ